MPPEYQGGTLLSCLAARWDPIPVRERAGLGLMMSALLDYSGVDAFAALGRAVDSLA